jgi:hypothetical protein
VTIDDTVVNAALKFEEATNRLNLDLGLMSTKIGNELHPYATALANDLRGDLVSGFIALEPEIKATVMLLDAGMTAARGFGEALAFIPLSVAVGIKFAADAIENGFAKAWENAGAEETHFLDQMLGNFASYEGRMKALWGGAQPDNSSPIPGGTKSYNDFAEALKQVRADMEALSASYDMANQKLRDSDQVSRAWYGARMAEIKAALAEQLIAPQQALAAETQAGQQRMALEDENLQQIKRNYDLQFQLQADLYRKLYPNEAEYKAQVEKLYAELQKNLQNVDTQILVLHDAMLQKKYEDEEAAAEKTREIAKQTAEAWKQALQPLDEFFKSSFEAWFEDEKNWRQKVEQDWNKMVGTFAADLAEMAVKWAASQAAMSVGQTSIGAALNPFGAGATGLAQLIGPLLGITTTGTIQAAAEAANTAALTANTTALLASSVSSNGGFLGAVAQGFGAIGSISAFATGAEMITAGGIGILHPGEMVVPAESAGPFRTALSAGTMPQFGDNGAPGATGGDTHNHYYSINHSFQSWDSRDVARWHADPQNQALLAKALRQAYRNGHRP